MMEKNRKITVSTVKFNVGKRKVKFKNGKGNKKMEKAKSDLKVKLSNGQELYVKDITLEQAKLLPLDGKKNEASGKFTSVSLKRALVKDDGKEYIERRVFKNADTDVIVYDLSLPLTLEQAKTMYGENDILDAIWIAKRIKTDAIKAGKGQGDPIVSIVKRAQKGDKLTTAEKELVGKWFASMAGLQEHGLAGGGKRK